jgi:hypothetical protein
MIDLRYIDRDGNRYATRFNKRSRKIDIIRIALGMDEAGESRNKHLRDLQLREHEKNLEKKKNPAETKKEQIIFDDPFASEEEKRNAKKTLRPYELPKWIKANEVKPDKTIDPSMLLHAMDREINKFTDRFRGVVQNIRGLGVFNDEKGDSGHSIYQELNGIFQDEILELMTDTVDVLNEFKRTPRSVDQLDTDAPRPLMRWLSEESPDKRMKVYESFFISDAYFKAMEAGLKLLERIEYYTNKTDLGLLGREGKSELDNILTTSDYLKKAISQEAGIVYGWLLKTGLFIPLEGDKKEEKSEEVMAEETNSETVNNEAGDEELEPSAAESEIT